jgi:hypothetical protein
MTIHDAAIERLIGALAEIEAAAGDNAERSHQLLRRPRTLRWQL